MFCGLENIWFGRLEQSNISFRQGLFNYVQTKKMLMPDAQNLSIIYVASAVTCVYIAFIHYSKYRVLECKTWIIYMKTEVLWVRL